VQVAKLEKTNPKTQTQQFLLFPVAVGVTTNAKGLTLKETDYLTNLEYDKNLGNKRSQDSYLLKNSKLTNLNKWIQTALNDHFQTTFKPKHDINLSITQSWCNKSEQNEYHHKHHHPNSFLSGVYYIQTNEDDQIEFSVESKNMFQIPTNEFDKFNSESWWLPVRQNELFLFPSWLQHRVPPVKGDKTRISLSFNTFPSGILGEELHLTELKL
jgi:uncharacterized protein (TIGR02466 family)